MQGLCNAPHDPGMCWKQFMMCLEDSWFVAAFHSTPMHDPGLKEVQRPARVCVCKGASVLPCLLSCSCWRRRPPAVRRSRLRAAPPPDACPPESPWCRPHLAPTRTRARPPCPSPFLAWDSPTAVGAPQCAPELKRWSSGREKTRGQVNSLEERANEPEEVIGGFKNRRRLCAWRRKRRSNIRQLDEAGREFAVERHGAKNDANRVAESKEVMCQMGALFR